MTTGIFEITPFTMTDYTDKICAVVWFSGCNMRCKYCYNAPVVLGDKSLSIDKFLNFLNSRQNKLQAIVFSGGECTLNQYFLKFAKEVKTRNFKLKVDTNGSNLDILKCAIDDNLIDYIALDFKAPKDKFKNITNSNLYENFIKTLEFLLSINFNFEVRTTIHFDLLNEDDISHMAEILYQKGYKKSYFLQKFLATNENFAELKEPKNSFDITKIRSNLDIVLRNFSQS